MRMNEDEKRRKYRDLFGSLLGAEVLADLMLESSYFNDDVTAEMGELIGKRNLCNYILRMLTSLDDPASTIKSVVRGMTNVPLITPKKEEEESNG